MEACLLDFGGTLDGDGAHWLDRFAALYARLDVRVPRDLAKEAFDHAERACVGSGRLRHHGFAELVRLHATEQLRFLGLADASLAESLARGFYEPASSSLRANAEVLRRLSDRVAIGIVSNWYGNLREVCEEFGIACSAAALIDSEIVGVRKPDPRIFRIALDRLAVPPDRTCFVGDNFDRDLRPAKALGMRTAWVVGEAARRAPEEGVADWQLRGVTALERLFP